MPVETRIVEVSLLMYIGSVLLQSVSGKESYVAIILHVREVREMRESCILYTARLPKESLTSLTSLIAYYDVFFRYKPCLMR